MGLGDVIKGILSAVGVQPCALCQRRAEKLNQWTPAIVTAGAGLLLLWYLKKRGKQ